MRVEYRVTKESDISVTPARYGTEAVIRVSRFGFAADELLDIEFQRFADLERFSKEVAQAVYRIKSDFIERRKGGSKRC